MLANHWNGLGRGDVVPRVPVVLPIGSVEVLLDDLFSPGQSVAAAHWEIMADRVSVSPAMTASFLCQFEAFVAGV